MTTNHRRHHRKNQKARVRESKQRAKDFESARAPLDAPARLLVRKILSGIARAGERYGRRKIAAMLVGKIDELPESLTRLSTTGLLQEERPRAIERWIDAASGAGLIRVSSNEYSANRPMTSRQAPGNPFLRWSLESLRIRAWYQANRWIPARRRADEERSHEESDE